MIDRLTPKQRSYCMSRVGSKDTDIERAVCSKLHKKGFRYRKHSPDLPGKPDIVFRKQKIAIFIDGDFWHGYRYPKWRNTLSPYWQHKIERNIKRDKNNFAKLRRMGWVVVRVWGHDVNKHMDSVIKKITRAIENKS